MAIQEQGTSNTMVSVIVPALNEEGNIGEFCRQFDEMQKKARVSYELVYVDDGSTDNTLKTIEAASKQYGFVTYATHQRNRGLTAALQTGFGIAKGDIYVFWPADLQFKPEDIPTLVEPVLKGADICTGWKQGKYKKKFVSSVYNWFSRKLFSLKVHDLNAVKAFRKEVVERTFMRRDWHRYLIVLAADEGYHIDEVKIPLYERNWGQSKFSAFRIPVGVLDLLSVWFQVKLFKKPLLYFGFAGLMMFTMSFLVGILAVYLRVVEHEGYRPLLYLVILLAGLGMGFFVMGFVLEVQTALKEEIGDLRMKLRQVLSDKNDTKRGA